MREECPIFSLSEVTDGYLLRTGNDRRKYYARYFSIAGDVYRELARTIMPTSSSMKVEVQYDVYEPFPFIWKPKGMMRFFGVWVTNKKGQLIQTLYDDKIDVYPAPPRKRKCGCNQTPLCDCIDDLQVTLIPRVIDGTTYMEKAWVKCCPNGDVLEYREVPVKSYGTEGGSYSNDYGEDYDIINEGSNVATLFFTKNLGRLETKPCGCPVDSDHNRDLIYNKCGSHCCNSRECKIWHEKTFSCTGRIKWSACGEKLYLVDVKPDHDGCVLISAQYDAIKCGEEVFVWEYARSAMWAGIDRHSTMYNPRIAMSQKEGSRQNYEAEKNRLFEFLNPLNSDRLFRSVTSEIKF